MNPGAAIKNGGPMSGVDVSVVIPCFNAKDFVGEAIRSVRCSPALCVEVIVVDDGSTDG